MLVVALLTCVVAFNVDVFSGIISHDLLGTSLMCMSLIILMAILSFYNANVTSINYTPYTINLIIIIMLIGSYYLMTSTDLLTAVISLEVQSFAVYAITSIYRNDEGATSAGLMYFMLGAFSSGLVLLGISMIYATTGTTDISAIMAITSLSHSNMLIVGTTLTLSGFLFKITASPFHYWGPDVYDRVPTIITVLIAIMPKFGLFAFIVRMVTMMNYSDIHWLLTISVVLSFAFGSIVGLVQTRIKRMMAYSTINHIGWMIMSVSIGSMVGLGSFSFYILQYSLTTVLTFLCLIAIGYTKLMTSYANSSNDVGTINSMSGLYMRSVSLAIILAVSLYSAAGIPPMIGFYAKLSIMQAMLFNSQYLVAVVGILSSIVSAGFYLSVISVTVFFSPNSLSSK